MTLINRILLALLLASAPLAGGWAAGDLGNGSVYSQTDASNNTATDPGWPESMAASRVNDAARALQGAIKRDRDKRGATVTSGGTDTITLTYSVAPAAYYQGDEFCFVAGGTNTGAATLNVNGLGAKAIKKGAAGSTALAAGDITAGGIYCVQYDSTNMQLLVSPSLLNATTTGNLSSLSGLSAIGSVVHTASTTFAIQNAGVDAWGGTAGGTANAQTVSVVPAITGYVAGTKVTFAAAATNTGATTISVNSIGTKNIFANGAALVGGEIVSGKIYTIVYDGTQFNLQSIYPGQQTIWFPAGSLTARTTSGCAAGTAESTTNKVMTITKDCDQTTAEYVQAGVAMPKSWNLGTVTAQFVWASGVTGNVIWGAQCVSIRDDDVIDTAFGTAQTVTDSVTATTDVMVSAATSAITCGGTPTAGAWTVFQFYRDAAAGGDTAAGDAKLIGVKVLFSTNAVNDN